MQPGVFRRDVILSEPRDLGWITRSLGSQARLRMTRQICAGATSPCMARLIGTRQLTAAWLVFASALASIQAVYFRSAMNPDGIAYLDMGDAYLRGDWPTALRTHWSPLYAWLLGVALRLVEPQPSFEFPLVHLVNLIIYCLALGTFTFLVYEVLASGKEQSMRLSLPAWSIISIGYAIFVWCTLEYMPLGLVTPDLLVSALVYAICGVILRMRRQASWQGAVLLGSLLGLGYLAKAPMVALATVFLAVSMLVLKDRSRRVMHVTMAGVALALVVLPFVLTLSVSNGRLTLGDSAALNYLWRIDGAPFVHWQGGPLNIGQPVHHSTMLLDRPAIWAFESPFQVTYAAWYAPEYWFQGATPALIWSEQRRAIGDALTVFGRLAVDVWVPLLGLAVLLAVRATFRFPRAESMVLLAPAVAAGVLYAVVLVEGRYVAPFLVLLLVGLVTMVRLPKTRSASFLGTVVSAVIVLALLVQVGLTTFGLAERVFAQPVDRPLAASDDHAQVAMALRSAGIQPGDPVASGNRGFNAYWARLARLTIVAEVSGYDGTAILESDAEARRAAQQLLLTQDVRAVVAYSWPALTGDPGWQPIAGTNYFYYRVPAR